VFEEVAKLIELFMVEQRYLAVREVLDFGATITQVAVQYGVDGPCIDGSPATPTTTLATRLRVANRVRISIKALTQNGLIFMANRVTKVGAGQTVN
jgi:hypothetical protein